MLNSILLLVIRNPIEKEAVTKTSFIKLKDNPYRLEHAC